MSNVAERVESQSIFVRYKLDIKFNLNLSLSLSSFQVFLRAKVFQSIYSYDEMREACRSCHLLEKQIECGGKLPIHLRLRFHSVETVTVGKGLHCHRPYSQQLTVHNGID